MKKETGRGKTNRLIISAVCTGILLLTSCDMLYQPVKSYLKEYTETATIVSYELDGSYPAGSDGILCLPSGSSHTVTFQLRNPQSYTFDLSGSSLPDTATTECGTLTAAGEDSFSVTQSTSDKTVLYATLSDALLTALDKGGDVTITMNMTEQKSGRSFDSYTLPLHADSPPPEISGTVVYTDIKTNTYVVCFYMPAEESLASAGIHSDIVSLTINGTVYPVTLETDGTFTFSDDDLVQTDPGIAAGTVKENYVEFTDKTGSPYYLQPVYFLTTDDVKEDDTSYTLTLTDDAGLSSTVKTSVNAVKLGDVTVQDSSGASVADGDELSQDDDSSFSTITISAPSDNSDATVMYEVYTCDSGTDTLLFDGTAAGEATLELPAGSIKLFAYARKSMYADSDPVEIDCTVTAARLYVDPDYTGTSTGSLDYPFTSISDAVAALSDKTSPDNTITLLGDITAVQNSSHSGTVLYLDPADYSAASLTLTLTGDGSTSRSLGSDDDGLRALYVADNVSVTLKNIAVHGWNSDGISAELGEDSEVKLIGTTSFAYEETALSSYKTYEGTVVLDGTTSSTAALVIAGTCTTANDKIAVLDPVYRGTTLPVITTTGSVTLTESVTDKFDVTCSYNSATDTYTGYYVVCTDGTGLLMPTGLTITVDDRLPATLSLSADYTAATDTAAVTVTDDGTDVSTELTGWTITVLDSSNRQTGVSASSETDGTAPSVVLQFTSGTDLPDGVYNMLVVFTYNGVTYSATAAITKS